MYDMTAAYQYPPILTDSQMIQKLTERNNNYNYNMD